MVEDTLPWLARRSRLAGAAAGLGGVCWLLLVPAAELVRRDLLSYDAYNRLLAVPLLLFSVALALTSRSLSGVGQLSQRGFAVAAAGAVLLFLGNAVEFYGVLLQDRPNAYAAYQSGQESWIGSDVGWLMFLLGALVLLVGGIAAAVGLRRDRVRPRWLGAFAALLGVGVLAGSLLGLGPA